MKEIMFQIIVLSLIGASILYFLLWRLFSKVGNSVSKEISKIKDEVNKEDN